MRILAIMLALVWVLGDGPATSKTPITPTPPKPEDFWHIALPEAIRIGLDNSEPVQVEGNSFWIGAQKIDLDGFEPTVEPASVNVPSNVAQSTGGDSGPDEE